MHHRLQAVHRGVPHQIGQRVAEVRAGQLEFVMFGSKTLRNQAGVFEFVDIFFLSFGYFITNTEGLDSFSSP